jgi:hypothetical protein
MLPVRERRRKPDWNIEGEPGLSRRPPAAYDPPLRPESGSSFETVPTGPISPAGTWSPIQTISRWWTSINPSKNAEYQTVHLLSTRKNSKLGNDDEDHPEPAFTSPLPQSQVPTSGNERTPAEVPPIVVSDSERKPVSRPHTPQPETEPLGAGRPRITSLRPNRPGNIVAVEGSPPSQPLLSVDVS